jgi:colanic acid biosynthesis glycosyl transferase WcaI
MTRYRAELGIGDEPVVMYAGNVGLSQSLTLLLDAARALPDVVFVINGDGAARPDLERRAAGLANVRFGDYQPEDRLAEVLATADLHVVALRRGLGRVSVPSKTYSILAAGRPLLAAIDPGTEVTRLLDVSGAGIAVAPDDPRAFVDAVARLVADPRRLRTMGDAGRRWAERHVGAAAVGARYVELLDGQARRRPPGERRR